MFKLNYTELTISRPESLIINPTKNYLDGYNEFLAKGKNKNTTVGRILEIIHNWNPRNADIEADYRDRFEIQLKKYFPSNAVKPEQKIGEKQGQGIIDIKVDEVLIEIKSDDALNARYRAVGQINHYSKTHKGPIILLFFDYEKICRALYRINGEYVEERTTNNYSYCKGKKSRGSRITTYTHFTRLKQAFKLKIAPLLHC